jgi:hypothetical protein
MVFWDARRAAIKAITHPKISPDGKTYEYSLFGNDSGVLKKVEQTTQNVMIIAVIAAAIYFFKK